jgi:hypothetical protein
MQNPKFYVQHQTLMVGSCQGNFQQSPQVTNLNTTTLDRFAPNPPSPSLFVSTSSTNPVCSSNEPVSIHEIYCYCFHINGLLPPISFHFSRLESLLSSPAVVCLYIFFPISVSSQPFIRSILVQSLENRFFMNCKLSKNW